MSMKIGRMEEKMENIMAIVMAAGKGTRMKSKNSKLVQKIYGKEIVKRAFKTRNSAP